MAMKMTYSWIIYSCLVFGSGILYGRKLERRQAVSSCSVNTDKFHCSNGLCIEWSWVCDGRKDCSDGLDETNELCALYDYGTNLTTGCGRSVVNNTAVLIDDDKQTLIRGVPWSVGIYYFIRVSKYPLAGYQFCEGSIIAPNVVISVAQCFSNETGFLSPKILLKKGPFRIAVGKYDQSSKIIGYKNKLVTQAIFDNNNQLLTQIIKVETIYVKEAYDGENGFYAENIAVILLENKVSFSNAVAPVCIDWNSKYKVHTGDIGKNKEQVLIIQEQA
ncbi:suppressor of tumorigenicity 14 protein homolog isoform X2 [Acyrthosiphon pisum]|uniref:Peptidase S1 domain-containing protein n=1 Tax=Acyrthosiphon pisum TaxID=7029 RepID=A0A8R2D5H6_ACYPI|nr:suppressor of tumorigenicity 14 protein homolog isoform X2 [Acyrthosiphon pisum]|eukprot:XP_016661520.1 PREDICTED: suppressor of tumorigenicity 14 protein homolog [Acyrthosiphon pisum]